MSSSEISAVHTAGDALQVTHHSLALLARADEVIE